MRVVAVTALAVLVAATAASARTQSRPSLRIARSTSSLVVRGTGFYARESVRVTVTAGASRAKTVRTSSTGRFAADFGTAFVDPCDAILIRAAGRRGDRALLKIPPRACISQSAP
jgi:hypothetical protein